MTYKEQLRHPMWQKKKAEILTRDNYTCQNHNCGTTDKNLQVHHLEYFQGIMAWEYSNDMLITLCEDCHDAENGRVYLEKNLATTLKMKGFLVSDLVAFSCLIDSDNKFSTGLLNILRNFQNG